MNPHQGKPPNSTWTDEQWQAITAAGQNVLVAAAAGSGKTAVLVERIIRRITDEYDPVDVDRLLVATFTNAAAAEMRQRIREALEKKLAERPDSLPIKKQLAFIQRAAITTLHSFCLDVIGRYYQTIGLDPAFRIANETEIELLRQDVLQETLEEYYGNSGADSDFWKLADWYGGERGDDALSKLVLDLYDYSRSHPWPDHWLRETAERFRVGGTIVAKTSRLGADASRLNLTDLSEQTDTVIPNKSEEIITSWQESLLQDVRLELKGASRLLGEAMRIADCPGGPAPYLDNLRVEREMVARLFEASNRSWNELYQAFRTADFGKLKPCRGDAYDSLLQEKTKTLREQAKKRVYALRQEMFDRDPGEYIAQLTEMAPVMRQLSDIVIEYAQRFRLEKASRGLVDFSDLEHFCLQILRGPESTPDCATPSQAALDYREQFVEVLLDEYQDTNMVQEAIVALVSRPDPGNRFMVGDVKQSIYRFRLAEPGLFLQKYSTFAGGETFVQADAVPDTRSDGAQTDSADASRTNGMKIDLARNFRSRREIIDGTNFIFRQTMRETAAEIDYDRRAELVYNEASADFGGEAGNDFPVEMWLLEGGQTGLASGGAKAAGDTGEAVDSDVDSDEEGAERDTEENAGDETEEEQLETAQFEARCIAARILRLMGDGGDKLHIYDKSKKLARPVTWRDIVILLRATQSWASVFVEELRLAGIPAYADLNTGYFSATEVQVMLSLLSVIDNPHQDIPLAAVLRSPIVGFNAEQLAKIRIYAKHLPFYAAVRAYAEAKDYGEEDYAEEDYAAAEQQENPALQGALLRFWQKVDRWRNLARHGSLADLIWRIYRETGYFDWAGGMPGGMQRQANLRALYDRARQFEATSFRGLFRFLRFAERMRDSGADLGTARALGEQEDVVRIMSIHKSKGLEFPVVFVAGLGKPFNRQDLNGQFLLHKELGFGPKFIDAKMRVAYPTLPLLALRRRLKKEALAEELRVLYVALTRAREKLILIGTAKNTVKRLENWGRVLENEELALPDDELAHAGCFLDWLGPALIRHPAAKLWRKTGGFPDKWPSCVNGERSRWTFHMADKGLYGTAGGSDTDAKTAENAAPFRQALLNAEPVVGAGGKMAAEVASRLSWRYPHTQAQTFLSKTSVSEMKRLAETFGGPPEWLADEWDTERLWSEPLPQKAVNEHKGGPDERTPAGVDAARSPQQRWKGAFLRRPRFLEQRKLSPEERGTVYHAVMQQLPLTADLSVATIVRTSEEMEDKRMLTREQREAVDPAVIYAFFRQEIGKRLLRADRVLREVPFSIGLPASEVYPWAKGGTAEETVLVQGVIDCLFEQNGCWMLLDYKTDAVYGKRLSELVERYRMQMILYGRAVERIWQRPLTEKVLFFFDGGHVVKI